ncbi:MAG: hypothetical protein HY078_16325 [Elusimicrobia bacterium]|nr:hypothetical protein [Elusimicrobiota bacterium]
MRHDKRETKTSKDLKAAVELETEEALQPTPELDADAETASPQVDVAPVLQLAEDPRRTQKRKNFRDKALAVGVCFTLGAMAILGISTIVSFMRYAAAGPNGVGARPSIASSIMDVIRKLRARPMKDVYAQDRNATDAADTAKTAKAKLRGDRPRTSGSQTSLQTPNSAMVAPKDSLGFVVAGLPAFMNPNNASAQGVHTSQAFARGVGEGTAGAHPNNPASNLSHASPNKPGGSVYSNMMNDPGLRKKFSDMLDFGIKNGTTINYQKEPARVKQLLKEVPSTANAFNGNSPIFDPGGNLPSQEFLTVAGEHGKRAEEIDLHPPEVTPVCGYVKREKKEGAQQWVNSLNAPVRKVGEIEQLSLNLEAEITEEEIFAKGKDHKTFDYCCINERWVAPDTRYQADVNKCVKLTPLVFDLKGDGVRASERWVNYDLRGNGRPQKIHDLADGMGLLVFDADKDGVAGSSGLELFGDRTALRGGSRPDGYKDGFEALDALVAMAEADGAVAAGTRASGDLGPSALRALESRYGLGMRVGGVKGATVSLEAAGIAAIRLSRAASGAAAPLNAIDDVVRRDGAVFVRADGTIGSYEDVLLQVWEKLPARTASGPTLQKSVGPRATAR